MIFFAYGGVVPKKSLLFLILLLAAVAVLVLSPQRLKAATIVAYVEAPTLQSSSVPGVVTETFNSFAPGNYTASLATAIGTYRDTSPSSRFAIVGADQYGGAGGTGNYFAVGAESGSTGPVVVNLNMQANYFGFWWPAGDPYNVVTFQQNGVTLATFSTADIISLLPRSGTVTAINGTKYNTDNYYGNPNSNISPNDANEPFAYVDIIANGLTFNQVGFTNANLGTGFESDNHSIANGVTDPPSGDVVVRDVPLDAIAPEPGSMLLLSLGVAFIGLSQVRRVSRA